MLLVTSWWFLVNHKVIQIPTLALSIFGLAIWIGIQFLFDVILMPSTALLGIGYLLAFALSVVLGSHAGKYPVAQLTSIFFLAIGVASILSVGMQLHQWLNLETDLLEIWSMGPAQGRPFANFGQPNQIATFLLWGIAAIAWGYLKKNIRPSIAIFALIFIVWGIALSHSRTAWIGMVLLFLSGFVWRYLWPNKYLPWICFGLGVTLSISLALIGWLNTEFGFNAGKVVDGFSQMSMNQRFQAWHIFFDALRIHPWLGYGFDQVKLAEMVAAPMHPAIHAVFAQSHNLFLDFLLWFGIPLGLICSIGLIIMMSKLALYIQTPERAVLWLMVLLVGNHAMLELPLHYAYFLLPTGFILGLLEAKTINNQKSNFLPKVIQPIMISFLCLMSLGFSLLVNDYFAVESSYRELRFELANFQYQVRGKPPDVIILTQFRDFIHMARMEPEDLVTDLEIDQSRRIVSTSPSPAGMYKLALALALRNEKVEAQLWLQRLCKVMEKTQCLAVKANWVEKSKKIPILLNINWDQIDQD